MFKSQQRIDSFFEQIVPRLNLGFVLLVLCLTSYIFDLSVHSLSSLHGQFGVILLTLGLLGRVFANSTARYLNTIKITGLYGICRQPLAFCDFFIIFGMNVIIGSWFCFFISFAILILFEINYLIQYDKILCRAYKDVYQVYKRRVHLFLPNFYNLNQIFSYKINLFEFKKSDNCFIFALIYIFLILSSILHVLHN